MKEHYCENCHHLTPDTAVYCSNCGQKNITGRLRFRDLMKEFLSNIFNWDSKIFITPIMLLRPGFLTKEFFKGRRKRYTHPGRLLLSSLIIYFAIFMFYVQEGFDSMDADNNFLKKEHAYFYVENNKDTLQSYLQKKFPKQKIEGITDTIENFIVGGRESKVNITLFNKYNFSSKDMLTLTDEEMFEKYKLENYAEQLVYRKVHKLAETPGGYIRYVVSRSSWIILLSIPFLALGMALIYIRQKKYYVEHVVFLMHINSFIFVLGIFMYIIGYLTGSNSLFSLLPYVIGTLYIYPAMKVFYGQGYFKTFVKYCLLMIASFWVFLVLMLMMFAVGILLF